MTEQERSRQEWRGGYLIRWALIGAVSVVLFDQLSNPLVAGGIALVALSNLLVFLFSEYKIASPFYQSSDRLMPALRFADGIGACLLSAYSGASGYPVYLLAIPPLVVEALSNRDAKRLGLMLATFIAALFGAASLGAPQHVIGVGAALLLISAVVAFVLAGFRERDTVLVRHERRLSLVLECGAALAANRNLRSAMLAVLKAVVHETGATCGYIMQTDDDDDATLVTEVAYSIEGEFQFPERLEVGSGLSGYVAQTGQPVNVSSVEGNADRFDGLPAGVHAAACVPLIARSYGPARDDSADQILGVLTLLSYTGGVEFDSEDMELVRTLASLLAIAVANSKMETRQHATFLRTMESLATALEARDEYTRGHSQRVSEVSMMIGERMGLSAAALEELRVGTILHDIGKIGVPDAILNKPGKLSEEEFEIMKTHTIKGYEICKPLNLSDGVLMIIRNHHERLDGSGYPDGLRGGDLPLPLRIVCVADAFDAMSSRRPYRSVMAPKSVLSELSRHAGTQFDPVVVEHLKELLGSPRMVALYYRGEEGEGEKQWVA